jgi:hypothetical protein
MDIIKISAYVTVFGGIGTVILLWDKIKPFLYRTTKLNIFSPSEAELRKLKISPRLHLNTWQSSKKENKFGIIIHSYFLVSNLSESFNNTVTSAIITNYKTSCSLLMRPKSENILNDPWGSNETILPNRTYELWLSCYLDKIKIKRNKKLKIHLQFIDKYSNTYKVKNILFESKQLKEDKLLPKS